MTLAAVDRLVHHSTILEMNVESYRRRAAQAGHQKFDTISRKFQLPPTVRSMISRTCNVFKVEF
jgi:hypothetical protein